MAGDIIVLRFGSSVLRARTDLPTAVHEIYRWYRAGWRVIAVTQQSASLLGIALDRAGIPARVVDPREIDLTVEGDALDGEPVDVNRERIVAFLSEVPVIVVPGSFGHDHDGRVRRLGRGGSDLSAVFLAHALRANRCRLLDDVASLIQPKAVQFLERNGDYVEVAGLLSLHESTIGRLSAELVEPQCAPPTSVLLLGLGTVGSGVYQRLLALPEHFRVVGAFVRDRAKHMGDGIPPEVLYDSADHFVNVQAVHADVVVDALPGLEPSHALVRQFLAGGVSVVSANQTLIAEAGAELAMLAHRHRATLLYSAAVGGSAPMLEVLSREASLGGIRSIAGVLDSACNDVLDRCVQGLLLNEALRAVQACGASEADAAEALSGRDTARKLRLLARHAFGQELSGLAIEPLNAAAIMRMRAGLGSDETLRAVARAWKLGSRVLGQIQLEAVDAANAFASTHGDRNRLIITRANGEDVEVCGRGAGRWPATEAVVANLLDLRFGQLAASSRG